MMCADIMFAYHRGLMSRGSSPLTTTATSLSPTHHGLVLRTEIHRVRAPLITTAELQQGDLPFASGLILSLTNGSRRDKSSGYTQSAALIITGEKLGSWHGTQRDLYDSYARWLCTV
jgi:hypothetical protein